LYDERYRFYRPAHERTRDIAHCLADDSSLAKSAERITPAARMPDVP